jgi:transcriptional regulator with PAS, ATPase and Fis domain
VKGSHSEADEDQPGLLEITNGGVLFLDEIAKAASHLQAKLLKVVESKRFYRFGDYKQPMNVDIRFIAAVQPIDLSSASFLPDLKFRFGFPCYIQLPTVNERIKEGGPRIIQYCLENVLNGLELNEEIKLGDDCFNLIENYNFTGNYRELEAILRSAVIEVYIEGRNEIMPADLGLSTSDVNIDCIKYFKNMTPESFNSVKLRDIITYSAEEAKNIQKEIITKKVHAIFRDGKNIANVLMDEEGMSRSEANNHSNCLSKLIGPLRGHKKEIRGILKRVLVNSVPMEKEVVETAQFGD